MKSFARQTSFISMALTFILCGSGCLSFEKQTLVLFFPRDGKSIQALFIYEGLMVQGGSGIDQKQQANDLLKAVEDLEELVRGDAIIFGDPFFRAALKPRPNEKVNEEFLILFKPNLAVVKGEFLVNNGKITYCQPVTLRDPQKVAAGLNRFISAGILNSPAAPNVEIQNLFKKFARDGHPWLQFDKGRLAATVPGTPAFFQEVRKNLLDMKKLDQILQKLDELEKPDANIKEIVKQLRQDTEFAKGMARALSHTPLSVDQRRDMLTVAVGWGDNEPFQILSPFPHRAQFPNLDKDLHMHAKTLGVPVRSDVTVADVIMGFERTGQLPKQRE